MSVSMSTCTAQSDSKQKNDMHIVLGIEDRKWRWVGGGMRIRVGRCRGADEGWVGERITKLKNKRDSYFSQITYHHDHIV